MGTVRRGFSLVEVVIAIGIFSAAIVSLLALLPSLVRQAGGTQDALAAQGLPDPIDLELRRMAAGGFDQLAGSIPVMAAPLEKGLLLVAARDGIRVHAAASMAATPAEVIPPEDRYFAAEIWRFDRAPMRDEPAGAWVPLFVRVSWPYRVPGNGAPTAMADRSQFTFTLVLVR